MKCCPILKENLLLIMYLVHDLTILKLFVWKVLFVLAEIRIDSFIGLSTNVMYQLSFEDYQEMQGRPLPNGSCPCRQ